jgi:hypothetical protein
MAARWNLTGEDIYGSDCPGMVALGDSRALQLYEKRKAQAVDKIVNPPMKGPSSLRGQRASLLPGDITYLDAVGPGTSFEPAFILHPQAIQIFDETIGQHEQRINAAFYADLWLAITNDQRSIPATAREIVERHEEKMLQLGTTLERIQDELLDPMIERIFSIMFKRNLIPEAPREFQGGKTIKVEYISVMAKAQKLVGTAAIERLLQVAVNTYAVKPDVLDKIDTDKALEEYADMVGTPPSILVAQSQVDQVRAQRAQEQQRMAQLQQENLATQNTKNLASSTLENDNGLSRLMTSIGAAPAAGGPVQ